MSGMTMSGKHAAIALAALLGGLAMAAPALAQNEQFIPHLVYRTGAFSVSAKVMPVESGMT